MALKYLGIDIMSLTKDRLDNPYSQAYTDAFIDQLIANFPKITHIGISIPMNTNAEAFAERGSNFSIEPATYTAQFMDKIHAKGKKVLFRGTNCFFEGLYSFSKDDNVNGTVANWETTPDSWLARAANWIDDNILLFEDGDIIAPYPEASSHWPLTNGGNYNQFFQDLKTVLDSICTTGGITCFNGFNSHIWTSVIQGAIGGNTFTIPNMVGFDHYGTALGLGKKFESFSHGSAAYANTYTVPTSITENATNRHDFIPEKVSYNIGIELYVVDKGTGDWTMTIHKANNSPVQMPNQLDITDLTNSYQVTIPNANLVNGALNNFAIEWDNMDTDVTYHFHLTSTVGDGAVKVNISGDLNTLYCKGYKQNADPKQLELDLRKTFAKHGSIPMYLQEWGDYWSTDSGRSDPVRNQTQHEDYLESIYVVIGRLIDEGKIEGFQYWRALGGHEALMTETGTNTFANLYEGDVLAAFFDTLTVEGEVGYSRQASAALPGDNQVLDTVYTVQNNTDVATDDNVYVPVSVALSGYGIHQFKVKNDNLALEKIICTVKAKSERAPSTQTVYLQVYNHDTQAWVTVDSEAAAAANTEFTLTATLETSLADYYDAQYIVSFRIYQAIP